MRIERVDAATYNRWFSRPRYLYNSKDFAELNRYKVGDIHYLLISREGHTEPDLGIIFGESEGELLSPFSAPYGGWEELTDDFSLYIDAAEAIAGYCGGRAKITLPPFVYGPRVTAQAEALKLCGARQLYADVNHSLDISDRDHMFDRLNQKARKKLRLSLQEDFKLETGKQLLDEAYDLIERNRRERGYYLSMTHYQVYELTEALKSTEFFVLRHGDTAVASAVVNLVDREIAQVVYWGHLKEFDELHPMNYLSSSLMAYYNSFGYRLLDVGTSSIHGEPLLGLIQFKRSIGCETSDKLTLQI